VQAVSFPLMWTYDQHFKKEKNDERRTIFDCGVMANFNQESHVNSRDTNMIQEK